MQFLEEMNLIEGLEVVKVKKVNSLVTVGVYFTNAPSGPQRTDFQQA
jgi:hypothetical protein